MESEKSFTRIYFSRIAIRSCLHLFVYRLTGPHLQTYRLIRVKASHHESHRHRIRLSVLNPMLLRAEFQVHFLLLKLTLLLSYHNLTRSKYESENYIPDCQKRGDVLRNLKKTMFVRVVSNFPLFGRLAITLMGSLEIQIRLITILLCKFLTLVELIFLNY